MAAKRFWAELKSSEFAGLDRNSTLAILPVAATEQHGPHLPVMTDTAIAEGLIKVVLARLPDDLKVLILPTQMIGKSDEHGGNIEVTGIVARELRVRLGMLAVTTQWHRFGLPAGLYSAFELSHGIHAGDIETSLMLHFRPDLVDMSKAKRFPSKAAEMEKGYKYLRPVGQHAFGWIAQDINPDGAVGEASAATAEKGRLTAEHQADGFIALLRDVARFPLRDLA
jgi:creatinine amidohydrolase